MPVDQRFKKQGDFTPPQSEGAYLIYWVGGGAPGGPAGFNLPNDEKIREEEGSKSYTLYNKVMDLGESGPEFPPEVLDAFYAPEYQER